MESNSRRSFHPLWWAAGVSVILLAAVGAASLAGLWPTAPRPASTPEASTAAPPVAAATAPRAAPAASPVASASPGTAPAASPVAPACRNCGVVADIRPVVHQGQASGAGAVAGGVIGGVLGNNVGRGDGRALATIAGAVGGGLLGNEVEKSQRQTTRYRISLRMEDGSKRSIEVGTMPAWRVGDRVKLVDGALVAG